jgi:membrane fusion protein, multidrug efflux system
MNRPISQPADLLESEAIDTVRTALPLSEPPALNDPGFALPRPMHLRVPQAIAIVLLVSVIAGAAFFARWIPQSHAKLALAAEVDARKDSLLRVQVVRPKLQVSTKALVLPGSVQPLQETTIYPRASGYVRKWYFDIGDRVKAGDELTAIDAPEIEQQLKQARAQLAQAKASLLQANANSVFSKLDLMRLERLEPGGVASRQELDKGRAQAEVDAANVSVAQANIDAQQANLERLTQLKSFTRVLAPFDGIVTARTIEIGSLVTAGNGSPLFKVTATDPVRVFVQVPQGSAPSVKSSMSALVKVREFPQRSFEGVIARTAGALDSITRTMNTEVRVPNPNGELLTGMYAEVSLNLSTAHKVFEVPATALFNDAAGLRVAVVTGDDSIHLAPVLIERDNGATIEIAGGLDGIERVVRLANPELTESRKVSVAGE